MLLLVTALAGWLGGPAARIGAPSEASVALALGFTPLGLFLLHARPGHRVGTAMTGVGLGALVGVTSAAWSGWDPAAWAMQWTWWPPLVGIPLALAAFPDEPVLWPEWPRRARVAPGAGVPACLAVAAVHAPRTRLTGGVVAPPEAGPWLAAAAGCAGVVLVLTLRVVVMLWRRARSSDDLRRSQLLCLLPSGVLLVLGVAGDAVGVPFALVPGVVALPVGMAVAILRYRVSDLDLAVNRTLVWIVMTVAIAATFAVTVGLLSGTVLGGSPLVATAVGTGLIAAGFDPLRRGVQRLVERALFGDRGNPQAVLRALGDRLQVASDAGDMLRLLVQALTESLHVPHARMLVDDADGARVTVAEHGRPQPALVSYPLVVHGEEVGILEVAPRRAGEEFTPAEVSLLVDVAGQAAVAARAHRLTLELLRARETLVRAREEERLRLRRDLHDGLGPALAGTRLQLSVARSRLGDHADTAPLDTALVVLADCTQEVRRLVDGLRPAALDQGLEAAVRQRATALLVNLTHAVVVEGDLAGLPAAVEVAAYRIATEAMANVVKHARATHCTVSLARVGAALQVEVVDNGVGGPLEREGGVGVRSIATRAAELGGELTITPLQPGTRVAARIPLG